jgi:hypothetical protein
MNASQPALVSQDRLEADINSHIWEQMYLNWPGALAWLNMVTSWTLPQMQNWVYVAVLPIKHQDPYDNIEKMPCSSRAMVNLDLQPSTTEKDCFIVRVAGDEFSDCLQSLVNPPSFEAELDNFPVGNWASVAQMESYFGDTACIMAHCHSVIFVATQLRMCSEADLMDTAYCSQVL